MQLIKNINFEVTKQKTNVSTILKNVSMFCKLINEARMKKDLVQSQKEIKTTN